jgi:hypothetical protein
VCDGGPVIFINCVAERREWMDDAVLAGSGGRIQFSERRGVWDYGPLVDARGEPYGARYDFQPIADMPSNFEREGYFDWAARESIDCLREDRESISSGRDGLATLEVITAMFIAHKTGTQVPLPLASGLDHVEIRSTGK